MTFLDFGISVTTDQLGQLPMQLPTIIMYEGGDEQMRLPRRKGGKELGRDIIIKAFELDMRLAISMQAKPAGGK